MVYTARKECGIQLAIQAFVEADVVSAVPESATPAALGFSEQVKFYYLNLFTIALCVHSLQLKKNEKT